MEPKAAAPASMSYSGVRATDIPRSKCDKLIYSTAINRIHILWYTFTYSMHDHAYI